MISLDKHYRTQRGEEVKLLMTDGGGKYPVMGAYLERLSKIWFPACWTSMGAYAPDIGTETDLIEVRPKHKRWFVLATNMGHATKKEAQADSKWCSSKDKAVVEIEWQEGEGFDDC